MTLALTFYCPDCHQPLIHFDCGAYHCVNSFCSNFRSIRPGVDGESEIPKLEGFQP